MSHIFRHKELAVMIDPVSLKIHAATSSAAPFTDGDIEEMRRQLPPSDVTAHTATKIARNTVLKRLSLFF